MVDIVMATYNGAKFVSEQIDSILAQTYKDIKIIIRDDGSSDDTIKIINEYKRQYPNIITIVSDDAVCGCSCRNFLQALKSSTSDYVMFSDQDDVWLDHKVQTSLDRMNAIERELGSDKPILVYGSCKPVDCNLNEIPSNKKKRQEYACKLNLSNLLVQNYVHGCLMMINRTLANLMGPYEDDILMHDWWAALIASSLGKIEHIDNVMMLYRQHGNNVVGAVNVKSIKYIRRKIFDKSTYGSLNKCLGQAELLRQRLGELMDDERKNVLDGFIDLFRYGKIKRIYRLINGDYLKSDLIRIVGQILLV